MILLKDICALDNGAKFHNADLHIHSFGASHDVKDSTMTPEAIVESAVRQNLRVIAITDHNSNKNIDAVLAYAQAKHPGRILVLPGVEVTTAHGHLLVYFAPEKTKDLAKFLTSIDLISEYPCSSCLMGSGTRSF
jgi:predicted metal-dependent phosphoesterase TrpH